ncbi:MAG: DinB family protein [Bacteroidota bacterium]
MNSEPTTHLLSRDEIKVGLRSSFSHLLNHIELMSDSTFETPLAKGKWSPGQHLGHLILSTLPLVKALQIPPEKLQKKYGLLDRDEMTEADMENTYVKVLSTGMVKAPLQFTIEAVTGDQRTELDQQFRTVLEDVLKAMDRRSDEELQKTCVPHPAIGLISLRELLVFTKVHTIHHAYGIEKGLKTLSSN